MQLVSTLSVVASFVLACHANVIPRDPHVVPRDLADGFHSFPIRAAAVNIASQPLERRQSVRFPNPYANCTAHDLVPRDFANAQNQIESFCDSANTAIPPNTIWAWQANNALAFACNFASKPQPCTGAEFGEMNTLIDGLCGPVLYRTGVVVVNELGKGYGREVLKSGNSICGNVIS